MLNRDYKVTVPELDPFVVITNTSKYKKRQLILAEIKRNLRATNQIEVDFLNTVFDSDEDFKEIFNHYEGKYNKLIQHLQNQRRFKHTKPVEDYFRKKYMTVDPYNGGTVISRLIARLKNMFK